MCRGFKSSQAYHFKWRSQTLVAQGFTWLPFFYAHVPEMSIGCIVRHPWAWFFRIFCQTVAQVLPFWGFPRGQPCSVHRHLRDILAPSKQLFLWSNFPNFCQKVCVFSANLANNWRFDRFMPVFAFLLQTNNAVFIAVYSVFSETITWIFSPILNYRRL